MGTINETLKEQEGFSVLNLKTLAIVAMLVDHITIVFLRERAIASPVTSMAYFVYALFRGFGRLTMPLMVFCLVEGFYYTGNLSKYLLRLFIFAIISHFPYVFFNYGNLGLQITELKQFQTSIIANFFLALVALKICAKTKINIFFKILVVFFLLVFSWFCDWRFYPVILALLFYYLKNYKILKMLAFIFTIPIWLWLNHWSRIIALNNVLGFPKMFTTSIDKTTVFFINYYPYQFFFMGLFLVIPFLFLYNGTKGKSGFIGKYFFYIFYPVHLLGLGILRFSV